MPIPLNTNNESLFPRLGNIIGGANQENTARGGTASGRIADIYGDFINTDQQVVQTIYAQLDAYRLAGDTFQNYYQSLCQATLIQMANDSQPLNPPDLSTAIGVLQQQMLSTASGIQRPTVGSTVVEASGNYGDAIIITSTTNFDGRQLDYIFAETINVTVTSDQDRGATAGGEPITFVGAPAVNSVAWNWPQGSGTNISTNIINSDATTIISNGNFETWTSDVVPPTDWTIGVGTINSTVKRNATTVLRGDYSCEFLGNGSQLTNIQQEITLNASTVYGINLWLRKSSTPAAGVLNVAVLDNLGSPITDTQGNACSFNVTLTDTSVSASEWRAFNAFFRTPITLPPTTTLRIALTTALTNAVSLYIDCAAMAQATQLYNGGIYAAGFSGGTPSQIGDNWVITNTTTGTVQTFCRTLDRYWGLRDKGLFIPSITVGFIPDSLIS